MTTSTYIGGRLLVVDDEPQVLDEYLQALRAKKRDDVLVALSDLREELFDTRSETYDGPEFDVDSCRQGEEAIERVRTASAAGTPYAAIFLDINMPPGINGVETAQQIRQIDPLVNIVIVTGSGLMQPETLAAGIPPVDRLFLFKKPFHGIEFRQLATALCGKWRADIALREANETLEDNVRKRTAALFDLAYYDSATRLPNRRKMLDDLTRMIALASKERTSVGVILFDIERFNFINETMGYEFGTQLLREVAARLNEVLRDPDVAGRFGADSFACLVSGFKEAALPAIVERVRDIFADPFSFDHREIHVKCSMGVATFPDHGGSSEIVFRCAEAALHRSKSDVIRETIFYDTRMGAVALRRLKLETDVRDAIERHLIQPFFQPQVELATGRVCGVEVLARWVKTDGTIVPPDAFIPLVEESGLADELFASMLGQAAATVRAWRDTCGYAGSFSINVSAHQVNSDRLFGTIETVLCEYDLAAALLKLELTETLLLTDFSAARVCLNRLHEMGVDVQIDDFGTGYSSLQYLADLPFRGLKIDRAFVARIAESESQRRVVDAVIALGHSLDVTVTAEGIETPEQLAILTEGGCDHAQGYLIARPMPDAQVREWFAGHGKTVAASG